MVVLSGIYKVVNNKNGKTYIGRSNDVMRRWGEHKRHCLNPNNSSYNFHFYRALRYWGLDNFKIELIEQCVDYNMMLDREQYYIKKYDTVAKGYNSTYATSSPPTKYYENHPNSILTNEDVYEIRESYKNIEYPKEVYLNYKSKIAYATFLNVWRGHSWKGLHMDVYTDDNKKEHFRQGNIDKIYKDDKFLDSEIVYGIRKHYCEEILSHSEVYSLYSFLNENTFNDIWYGRTYTLYVTDEYIGLLNKRKYIRRGNNKNGKNTNNKITQ